MPEAGNAFLTIDLNTGRRLSFASLDEFERWFSEERKAWRWLFKNDGQQFGPQFSEFRTNFIQSFDQIGARLQDLKNDVGNAQKLQALHNSVQNPFNSGKALLKDHQFSQVVGEVNARLGPNAAIAALGTLLGIPMGNLAPVQGVFEAILLREGISPASPGLIQKALNEVTVRGEAEFARQRDLLAKQISESESAISTFNAEFEKLLKLKQEHWSKIEIHMNTEFDSVVKSIQATEAGYKAQMELQASVDYWTEKSKKHDVARNASQKALIRYSVVAGFSLLFFLVGLASWATQVAANDLAAYVKFAAVGAVAVTIVFWIARVLLRIFLSDRHLATDAAERVTMVKTFLALAKEKQLDPGDRALVLAPLFKSAADGIVRDDGPDASLAGVIARAIDIKAKP